MRYKLKLAFINHKRPINELGMANALVPFRHSHNNGGSCSGCSFSTLCLYTATAGDIFCTLAKQQTYFCLQIIINAYLRYI